MPSRHQPAGGEWLTRAPRRTSTARLNSATSVPSCLQTRVRTRTTDLVPRGALTARHLSVRRTAAHPLEKAPPQVPRHPLARRQLRVPLGEVKGRARVKGRSRGPSGWPSGRAVRTRSSPPSGGARGGRPCTNLSAAAWQSHRSSRRPGCGGQPVAGSPSSPASCQSITGNHRPPTTPSPRRRGRKYASRQIAIAAT